MARSSHLNQIARRAAAAVPLLTPPRAIFRRWGTVNPIMEPEAAVTVENSRARPNPSAAQAASPVLDAPAIDSPVQPAARTPRIQQQTETPARAESAVAANPMTIAVARTARSAPNAQASQPRKAESSPLPKPAGEQNAAATSIRSEQRVVSRVPVTAPASTPHREAAPAMQKTSTAPTPPRFSPAAETSPSPAPHAIANAQTGHAPAPVLVPRDRLPSVPAPALHKEKSPVIRIGSVEVQIVTQPAAPAPPARPIAAATPSAPLSRELISSFGLRQG
jgi:hypothetical protein